MPRNGNTPRRTKGQRRRERLLAIRRAQTGRVRARPVRERPDPRAVL